MLIVVLVLLLAIGIRAMIYGGKNIIKSIGFWLGGLVTIFTFMFVLISMYFMTGAESEPYILKEDVQITE
ncbi:hypothetical protein [Ornithinibacillus californiensis]|uniref:hypothetical protein n=1 Tax=Ornithinibacillus californiensis TaxID=161536 RepID=UPI00064E14C2|nr:hypothetical protein [Ornithinibacillus californiensis]